MNRIYTVLQYDFGRAKTLCEAVIHSHPSSSNKKLIDNCTLSVYGQKFSEISKLV